MKANRKSLLFFALLYAFVSTTLVSCIRSDTQSTEMSSTNALKVLDAALEPDLLIVQDTTSESTTFSAPPEPNNHPEYESVIRVGVSISNFGDNTIYDVRREIDLYFWELIIDDVKYDATILDGNGDAEKQMLHVSNFIEQDYDVMIVGLNKSSNVHEITEKAKAADIPVVYLHHEPSKEDMDMWDKTCFVGFDFRQSGLVQGEIIANLPSNGDINGDGIVSYVMITGDSDHRDAQYRTEYSIKALTDRGIKVEELFKQDGEWSLYKGHDIAEFALSEFGDRIDVIFCNSDGMAIGASQAIAEAGRNVNEDIFLVGWDALIEAVDMVYNGHLTGTVLIDDYSRAVTAAEAAINFAHGKNNEKYIWIDYVPIVADPEQ